MGRGLVVGALGDELADDRYDVRVMAALLRGRNFAVDVRTGPHATRTGILEGYDELIAAIRPDEPAVFYYTGHGFRGPADIEQGKYWQAICPTDAAASSTTDFRGITSWELSIKLAQLTARTRNATVILDCCYASQMSRNGAVHGAIPRAVPYPSIVGFDAHLQALREAYGAAFSAVDAVSNRDAVRLVACAQDSCAVMCPVGGEYRGVFTEALVDVLREVGDAPVSWAAIMPAIRARVSRRSIQRPEVEGPAHRLLFSLQVAPASQAVSITARPGGLRIEAGQLFGVRVGDVFGVMPPGHGGHRAADVIAEVTVRDVFPMYATAEPRTPTLAMTVPEGAIAIPLEKTAPRRAVKIDVPAAARKVVEDEIGATRILRVAGPDEAALATLRLSNGSLTIEDPLGPLFPAAKFPDRLKETVQNLANLGAAEGLRELEGEHGVRADELEIEWGVVEHQKARRMPEHGCALALRDRIYVKVRSNAQRKLWVHILNIGVRGKITLVTQHAPTGVALDNEGAELVLSERSDGKLLGLPLSWPALLPRETFPRIDELVVMATSNKISLWSLETVEHVRGEQPRASGTGSKLEALLAQLQDGRPRNLRGNEPIEGFFMKRLSYLLYPRDAAMADIPFEIDDNPLRQLAARAHDAWLGPDDGRRPRTRRSREISVEISDLVLNNRPMSTGTRLDGLICTRSSGNARAYDTWTRRLGGSENDSCSSPGNMPVYRGPIEDFVDICLWMSPDIPGAADLTALLERVPRSDFRDAAQVLDARSRRSPWVAAIGASAVMSKIVYEMLCSAAGRSVGIYRAAFVADELLGSGPVFARQCHTRDVSFTLRVEAVEG